MKKEILTLLIFILILLPSITAIEIKLSKEIYQPRETLQAEITGNFISLKPENILVYENDKVHSEPVIKDLVKRDYIYYFYAILPNKESNFSLKIQNTKYIESGKLKQDDIIKNFAIIKTNESALSINPGFVVANKPFSVKIRALDKSQDINAKIEESGETKNFFLVEENEKTIVFSILNMSSNKTNLKINNYNMPLFMNIKRNDSEEIKKDLDFIPATLLGIISSDRDYTFKVFIENTGDKNIENITISNNFNAEIKPSIIENLENGTSISFEITIKKPKKNISGEITAEFDSEEIILPVFFEVTQDVSKININNSGIIETLSCSSIGVICSETQECSGEIASSLEGPCCKGQCSETKQSSNYTWIFGILLLILLFIVIYFIFKRIRKNKRFESSQEIMKQRGQRYVKRINPSEEVRGKIERM